MTGLVAELARAVTRLERAVRVLRLEGYALCGLLVATALLLLFLWR